MLLLCSIEVNDMDIIVIYDEYIGIGEDSLYKKIISCVKEASCPNEALRSVTPRFKKLTQQGNTYTVYLDFDPEDDTVNSRGTIKMVCM